MLKGLRTRFVEVLVCYVVLVGITTVAMEEFSPRHTIFLLIDAILLGWGSRLFQRRQMYWAGLALLMGMICSVFLIRYLTPTSMKVWEVDTYISFAFALSNLCLMAVALARSLWLCQGLSAVLLLLLAVPLLGGWGYFFSEHAWLNVEAVMAILQTNPAEAVSYVRDRTSVWMYALSGVAVFWGAWLVSKVRCLHLQAANWKQYTAVLFFVVLNVVLLMRTSDNFVTSIYAETKEYQANYDSYERAKSNRAEAVRAMELDFSQTDGIFVLVIGESENRTRMSAYGYSKDTTPWLASMKADPQLLLFDQAYSCHVQTVPVLTYALTAKNQYNDMELQDAASIIDMAKAAGYDTVWLSNQVKYGSWGTPVSVIADGADQQVWINSHVGNTLDTDYYDGEILDRLKEIKRSDRMLIVIHLMGSHISYQSRYPAEFDQFHDEGKRSEYDNSVLYNDYFMQQLTKQLDEMPGFQGMVYFSDHGEAVNYGAAHNPATFLFDMAYIPFYMYFSQDYIDSHADTYRQLCASVHDTFTDDLIFNTMMGIMGIRDKNRYEPQNDLTSRSYDRNRDRFRTLYGKVSISEDAP